MTKHQAGVSLVELMISMVVGLFLLVGVVSNFISTKSADVKRDAVSEMDANAAEAFRVLRKSISHTGYRSIENINLENDMAFHIENTNVASMACDTGINRDLATVTAKMRTRDGDTKDFISVISLADNPCLSGSGPTCEINPNALVYSDCTGGGAERTEHAIACSTSPDFGMLNPADAKIYNSFWLIKNVKSPADRTLYCGGNRANNQPIVNNVETIQYLYGVKNDAGSITFRTATQVTAAVPNQWPMVVSVQVGLLMRSSNPNVLDKASSKTTYNVLNQNITIAASDLKRLFRVYTTTINLENRNSGSL